MRPHTPRLEGFPTRLQTLVDRFGSIRALASASGQNTKTLSDWLTGARQPHGSTLQRFCEAVDVHPQWLLYGKVEEAPPPSPLRGVPVVALDARESILAVAPTWLAWRFGLRPGDRVGILHATTDDVIPGEVEPEEPVLVHLGSYDGIPSSAAIPGEILLIREESGVERLYRVPENRSVPGLILGSALWTGRSLIRPRTTRRG